VRGRVPAGQAGLALPRRLMARYRVTLAYDGTDFQGWQVQAPGKQARTVQGVLEAELCQLAAGVPVRVCGAGRTDSGVHALGQVVCFDLARPMSPPDLARALNRMLPSDVRVLDAFEVASGFHPRRDARSKLYRYVLDMGAPQLPTRRRYGGHVPARLDPVPVDLAAELYLGRHDFASLASSGGSVKTTVRTLTRSAVRFVDHEVGGDVPGGSGPGTSLVYEVEADGFLRKMVRSLVGGLIAVGSHALSVESLSHALEARDRRAWPAPAPACGLTLVRVDYGSRGLR
jgi:tRNA pseudouridine38-40 synthase